MDLNLSSSTACLVSLGLLPEADFGRRRLARSGAASATMRLDCRGPTRAQAGFKARARRPGVRASFRAEPETIGRLCEAEIPLERDTLAGRC